MCAIAAGAIADEQKVQVERVLGELEVTAPRTLEVLNKVDLLDATARSQLAGGAGVVLTSAKTGEGLAALLAAIDGALVEDPLVEMEFRMPQSEGSAMAMLRAGAVVTGEQFEGNLMYLHAVGPTSLLTRYRQFARRDGPAE